MIFKEYRVPLLLLTCESSLGPKPRENSTTATPFARASRKCPNSWNRIMTLRTRKAAIRLIMIHPLSKINVTVQDGASSSRISGNETVKALPLLHPRQLALQEFIGLRLRFQNLRKRRVLDSLMVLHRCLDQIRNGKEGNLTVQKFGNCPFIGGI